MLRTCPWPGLLAVLLLACVEARAHPGHSHAPRLRAWKDAEGRPLAEASYVLATGDRVRLRHRDGGLFWVPVERLSRDDQAWVARRQQAVRRLNLAQAPQPPAAQPGPAPELPLALGAVVIVLAGVGSLWPLKRRFVLPAALLLALCCFVTAIGCGDAAMKPLADAPRQPKHDVKVLEKLFAHFKKDGVAFRSDGEFFYVESTGLPSHTMMVGITAWQQQVPIPQPYSGKNAWRIPLRPVVAEKPISAKKALYRGAIALAVNGVPIFNALNNRGEDAYLAGELDEYGGHCGRGDDYHYHIAPAHLEKVVGKGQPIAFALDGFPLYGYTDADGKEPKGLDEFNGRYEKDGSYRYYSTKKYPYINGGMRGVVTVRGDQVEPQPRDAPIRPAGRPLRGAKITGFERDGKAATLKYRLRGKTHTVKYTQNRDDSFTFTYTDADGKSAAETYRRRRRP